MVKRLLVAMVVLALTSAASGAQDTTAIQQKEAAPAPSNSSSNSSLGFKALVGLGLLTYDGVEGVTTETSGAYSLGIFWNWSTGGVVSFALQPELHFVSEAGVTKGFSTEGTTTTVESIRLPILGKVEFLARDVVQPSIYLGPSFSYVLGARNTEGETDTDIAEYNEFQVGLAIGVDVTFLRIFVIDLRYNANFTELYESVSMSSFRAGLGLRF